MCVGFLSYYDGDLNEHSLKTQKGVLCIWFKTQSGLHLVPTIHLSAINWNLWVAWFLQYLKFLSLIHFGRLAIKWIRIWWKNKYRISVPKSQWHSLGSWNSWSSATYWNRGLSHPESKNSLALSDEYWLFCGPISASIT